MDDNIIMYLSSLKRGNTNELKKIIGGMTPRKREATIISIFKFAVNHILRMSPWEAAQYIDTKVLMRLQLYDYVQKDKIEYPKGLPEDLYASYIIDKGFPEYHMSKNWIVDIYRHSLLTNTSLPVSFFNDSLANYKAYICLLTAIKEIHPDATIEQLYDFFATPKKANKFLRETRLSGVCCSEFGNDPLLYLHYALGEQGSNILAEANGFMRTYNLEINALQKAGKFVLNKGAKI